MIITILPSSANFHAIAYNEMKVEKGLATLLEVQNIDGIRPETYTADKLQWYFLQYSARNTYIKKPQFHVAVSCIGTEYSHRQLLDIAHSYLKEMGYAEEGQPLLVYAHHDTANNHIHIVTSRVAPDGHKIDHHHEKRRSRAVTLEIMKEYTGQKQEPEVNDIAKDALSYRFTTKAQFCAIMESLGYECKDDNEKPVVLLYRNGEELGTIRAQLIMQYALKENKPDDKRRRQLRAILQKYRHLSANKKELDAHMKRKFGISLVFVDKADTPYGYIVVDHKNKTVFKGGEFLSIKDLLQFEDAATRFAKIEQTIDDLLADNPKLTTADINRVLYRQFGTHIHRGTVSWNGETIILRESVVRQLHDNYMDSRGIVKQVSPHQPKAERSRQSSPPGSNPNISNVMDTQAGSKDPNREYEVGHGMNVNDVDDEQIQQRRWRR